LATFLFFGTNFFKAHISARIESFRAYWCGFLLGTFASYPASFFGAYIIRVSLQTHYFVSHTRTTREESEHEPKREHSNFASRATRSRKMSEFETRKPDESKR